MDEIEVVPQTALETLGDHNPDSVDIETLKACFPAIFATFADLGEWQILSALEGAFMDEKRVGFRAQLHTRTRLRCPRCTGGAGAHIWQGDSACDNPRFQVHAPRHAA